MIGSLYVFLTQQARSYLAAKYAAAYTLSPEVNILISSNLQ